MPDLLRYFVPGGTYFFTLVTARRAPLFANDLARRLLGNILRETRDQAPLATVAVVLLPNHLHTVWTLPSGDRNYPVRWQSIKAKFTAKWIEAGGQEQIVSNGYGRQRRRGVWQPRYMEHTIRDETDLENHVDYIHYNPVKHGLVRCPKDWPWSSFHRFVKSGQYELEWGALDRPTPRFRQVRVDQIE